MRSGPDFTFIYVSSSFLDAKIEKYYTVAALEYNNNIVEDRFDIAISIKE